MKKEKTVKPSRPPRSPKQPRHALKPRKVTISQLQKLGLPAEEINDTLKEVIDAFRMSLIYKDIQGGSLIKLFEYVAKKQSSPKAQLTKKVSSKK